MRRVICYVDGFNLYHAINDLCPANPRNRELKWLDLRGLVTLLLKPYDHLQAIRYFTAYATWLPGPWARHREYVAALGALGIDIHIARFKDKQKRCPQGHTWLGHEEKETDVHFAISILEDAFEDRFDAAIIMSADSDYVPVVAKVKARWPKKKVIIAAPPGRYGHARDLMKQADVGFEITLGRLRKSLLPPTVSDDAGNVVATRPVEYSF